MKVEILSILQDNYAYLITSDDGMVGVIDPGEGDAILNILQGDRLALDYIFNTHHHSDHTDGNALLKAETEAALVGPYAEKDRIKGLDIQLKDGDVFHFGTHPMQAISTPGHTKGHMCFYFPENGVLFTGDTLFSMGTGRLFEGSAQDLFESLQKIKVLPDETLIYCGHEYTQDNGNFCLSVEPDNMALQNRMLSVNALRERARPTLPVMLGVEKETNVFLRAETPEALATLRAQKEAFSDIIAQRRAAL